MVYLIFYFYSCKFKRLFSYRSKGTIPDVELHAKLGIPKERGLYQYGQKRFVRWCDRFPIPFAEAGISEVQAGINRTD